MSLLDEYPEPISDIVTLERLRLASHAEVPAAIAHSMEISQFKDVIFDRLVYKLSAEVLAEKLPPAEVTERTSVSFPSSSWQLFKEEHAESWWLGWLVRRRPVRRKAHPVALTVGFDRYRTFPECNYVFPKDLGGYVNVAIQRPGHWEGLRV